MFEDFLTDRADIYPIERNTSNRTVKSQVANKKEPELTNIPCRISKNWAFFMPGVELKSGDVILSREKKYEVIACIHSLGRSSFHHHTYEVKERLFERTKEVL